MTDLFFMFDRYKYNMVFNFIESENKYNAVVDEDINKLLPKFTKNNDVLSQYIYKIKTSIN